MSHPIDDILGRRDDRHRIQDRYLCYPGLLGPRWHVQWQAPSVPSTVTNELTMSYAGAMSVAQQYPQDADQITASAKTAFLAGDEKACIAGIISVLIGAALVFFQFPNKEDERKMLLESHQQDMAALSAAMPVSPDVAAAPSSS